MAPSNLDVRAAFLCCSPQGQQPIHKSWAGHSMGTWPLAASLPYAGVHATLTMFSGETGWGKSQATPSLNTKRQKRWDSRAPWSSWQAQTAPLEMALSEINLKPSSHSNINQSREVQAQELPHLWQETLSIPETGPCSQEGGYSSAGATA